MTESVPSVELGVSRRRMLAAGGAIGTTAWVAPQIFSVAAGAAASVPVVPCPPTPSTIVQLEGAAPAPQGIALSATRAYVVLGGVPIGAATFPTATNSSPSNFLLPATSAPTYIALRPSGSRAYVTDSNGFLLVCSAVGTGLIYITSVPVGTAPRQLAVSDTRAYVANSGSNSVSVVDIVAASPTENTVVATVPLTGSPAGIALTPTRAYVTTPTGLSAIDIVSGSGTENTVVDVIPLANASAIAIAGGFAYVTTGDALAVVDLATSAITSVALPPLTGAKAVGLNATDAFVLGASSLTQIDLATTTIRGAAQLGFGDFFGALAVSDTQIYVTKFFEGSVAVFDPCVPSP